MSSTRQNIYEYLLDASNFIVIITCHELMKRIYKYVFWIFSILNNYYHSRTTAIRFSNKLNNIMYNIFHKNNQKHTRYYIIFKQ